MIECVCGVCVGVCAGLYGLGMIGGCARVSVGTRVGRCVVECLA